MFWWRQWRHRPCQQNKMRSRKGWVSHQHHNRTKRVLSLPTDRHYYFNVRLICTHCPDHGAASDCSATGICHKHFGGATVISQSTKQDHARRARKRTPVLMHFLMYGCFIPKQTAIPPPESLPKAREWEEETIWPTTTRCGACQLHPTRFYDNGKNGMWSNCNLKAPRVVDCWKYNRPYSTVIGWYHCRLSFSLLRSSLLCVQGSRGLRDCNGLNTSWIPSCCHRR